MATKQDLADFIDRVQTFLFHEQGYQRGANGLSQVCQMFRDAGFGPKRVEPVAAVKNVTENGGFLHPDPAPEGGEVG